MAVVVVVQGFLASQAYAPWTSPPPATTGNETARPPEPLEGRHGSWGRLVTTPIVISPPAEYVPRRWGPVRPPAWYLPGFAPGALDDWFLSLGISGPDAAALRSTARSDSRIGGLLLTPDASVVRGLSPQTRATLYPALGRVPLNEDQLGAYRYFGSSVEEWLGKTAISAHTRRLVDPLVYTAGGFLFFADLEMIRGQIENPEDLQLLVKALLRQSTLQVRVRLDDPTQVDTAATYWGVGGRRTDIRPLLESVATSDEKSIDISHLLPRLAREHVYRYPRIRAVDLDRPLLVNCLWTALNFFNDRPNDAYFDEKAGMAALRGDYYVVHDNLQLGDIAAFFDSNGNLFHVAVYLADGLVFGKNGSSQLAPWSILPLERLKGHYVEYANDWHVTFHRRNDF